MGTQTASNSEGRNPIVARAVDLCKRYGKGDNSVIALDHVNVEFRRKALTAIMAPRVPANRRSCTAWPGLTPHQRPGVH